MGILVSFSIGALAIASVAGVPNIRYEGKRIRAYPANHHHPSLQSLRILQAIGCNGRVVNQQTLEISESCNYLKGMYRYYFRPTVIDPAHEVTIQFTIHRDAPHSHIFLVDAPIEVEGR